MPELFAPKPRRTSKRPDSRSQLTQNEGNASARAGDSGPTANVSALNRNEMIAEAAYFRAAERNFEPGHELEDWLAAESEVDQKLMARTGVQTSA